MTLNPSDLKGHLVANRYRITAVLARGGMATAYLATDKRLFDRRVVIKVPDLRTEDARRRFVGEARKLIELDHPRIVTALDAGIVGDDPDGPPFIAMKYLEGGNLHSLCAAAGGVQSAAEVARWLPQIAEALDFVHSRGVLHRDVKPGNILFDRPDPSGQAFLADFGVAKALQDAHAVHTGTGQRVGTARYLPPEASIGEQGPPFDQYSLACSVFEGLSGELPHVASSEDKLLMEKLLKPARPLMDVAPHVPAKCARSVMRALETDPKRRFNSCSEFACAFADGLQSQVVAPPETPRPAVRPTPEPAPPAARPAVRPSERKRRRSSVPLGAAAIAVVALGGYLLTPSGFLTNRAAPSDPPSQPTDRPGTSQPVAPAVQDQPATPPVTPPAPLPAPPPAPDGNSDNASRKAAAIAAARADFDAALRRAPGPVRQFELQAAFEELKKSAGLTSDDEARFRRAIVEQRRVRIELRELAKDPDVGESVRQGTISMKSFTTQAYYSGNEIRTGVPPANNRMVFDVATGVPHSFVVRLDMSFQNAEFKATECIGTVTIPPGSEELFIPLDLLLHKGDAASSGRGAGRMECQLGAAAPLRSTMPLPAPGPTGRNTSTPPPENAAKPVTGELKGRAVDGQDRPLRGVTVRIEGQGVSRTHVTDASGAFSDASLPPGGFRVTGWLSGFRTSTRVEIVRAGQSETTELYLRSVHPAAVANDRGEFTIAVEAGTYEVTIEREGFKEFVYDGVRVSQTSGARLEPALDVGWMTTMRKPEPKSARGRTIEGVVKDRAGAILPGAQVWVRRKQN